MAENQSNSGRVFLFAALILGVLAMIMAFAYIQSAANTTHAPTRRVVVAARDLPPNAILGTDDLKVISIPAPTEGTEAAVMFSRTIDPTSIQNLHGQRVNRFIPVDSPVYNADVSVYQIDLTPPKGCVNLSLPVRGSNALSGLLVPGDYVKLYVTRPKVGVATETDPALASSKWESGPVLPPDAAPLKVLAVGNRLSANRQAITASEQYNSASSSDAQTSVMFLVTEEQVPRILAMTGAGQLPLTIVLCPRPADASAAQGATAPAASTRPR